MRILVVNMNTTESMTEAIRVRAQAAASPGTEIVALTPFFGTESVEGNFESYLSAVAVMDRVVAFDGPYDAVVQAGFGEHGREGLQDLLEVPVVDSIEAAAHTACLIGRSYAVVATLDRAVPQIEDRLLLAGLRGRCSGVRAIGIGAPELDRDPEAVAAIIVDQARRAVTEDHAEVICLGCGGIPGLDERIRAATGVPVVDAVSAAVRLAEMLHGLGLRTSKVRSYARPRPKLLTGWPVNPRYRRA